MGTERTEDTPHIPLIVIRVQAPTPNVDDFVAQYSRYFGVDVVFLPTEGVQPPGRRVRFVFALADGTEAVTGEGVVLRMRRDSNSPQRPPGMELRYQCLDESSQRVVDRMLLLRTQGLMAKPDPPPYVSMWLERDDDTGRTTTVRAQSSHTPTLPANPFAEVPPQALSYFVDWAIERATDPARKGGRGRTEFARVKMRPPRPDKPRPRSGLMIAFSSGLATGALVLVVAGGINASGGSTSPSRSSRARVASDERARAASDERAVRGVGGNAAPAVHASAEPLAGKASTPVPMLAQGIDPPPLTTTPPVAPVPPSSAAAAPTRVVATAGHVNVASRDAATPLHGFARPSGGLGLALGVSSGETRESREPSEPAHPAPAVAPAAPGNAPHGGRDPFEPPAAVDRPVAKRRVPLLIVSTPPGAVFIDDKARGRTPLTTVIDGGAHEVLVERPRYLPGHAHVDGPGRVVLELERPPATLHVTSTPSGAVVRVDGNEAGHTPLNFTTAGYEQHKVEIEHEGTVAKRKIYLRPPLGSIDVDLSAPR